MALGVWYARGDDCAVAWDPAQDCYAPIVDRWGESSQVGLFIAGDGAGIAGAKAAQLRGAETIRASVRQGTRRDAQFCACGVNSQWDLSPLPFTMADLRYQVSRSIGLQPALADGEIASHCGVSVALVGEIRAGK